jgi:hypothetical protein
LQFGGTIIYLLAKLAYKAIKRRLRGQDPADATTASERSFAERVAGFFHAGFFRTSTQRDRTTATQGSGEGNELTVVTTTTTTTEKTNTGEKSAVGGVVDVQED